MLSWEVLFCGFLQPPPVNNSSRGRARGVRNSCFLLPALPHCPGGGGEVAGLIWVVVVVVVVVGGGFCNKKVRRVFGYREG